MRLLPTPALAVMLVAALTLAGCLHETKADIIKKAGDADTADQLRTALGEPDELNKAGPLEEWIYEASDGVVRFPVIAGNVGPVVTGEKRK